MPTRLRSNNRFKYVETIIWKWHTIPPKQNVGRFTPQRNRFMSLEDAILNFLKRHPNARRAEIRRGLDAVVGEATVWRHLKALNLARKVEVEGRGPATPYRLS